MTKTSCKKGQYYCNTDQKCKPIPDGYKVRKDGILVSEGSLRDWFGKSKSKGGKPGWVNVKTGGTCASDEPGEGVPKCVSRSKYDSMSKKEREYAHNKKRREDSGQQSKRNAAKPTYVSTDKPKKKMKEEFVSLPLQLEVPQNDGEFKLGLMFRESLEQDRGMLFIFESDDYWTFHMKNTYIPLDIAFLKEDGTIDSIEELEPMSPVPVGPNSEIRYAVEVNRGWFAENDVNIGDVLLEEEDLTEGKDKKGKGSGKKDACYNKVKSRYSVWPSAYASGALVKCRKVGAANWGNQSEGYILEEPKKSLSDRSFKKLEKRAKNFKLKSQEDQDQYALEVNRRFTKDGKGGWTLNRKTDQKNRRGRTVGHNKGIKDHYDWRSTLDLDEKSNIEKNLHTRGGKTAPEPNSQTTDTAIKKVGQKLKDRSFQEQSIMTPRERMRRSQQTQQNLSKATSGFKLSGSSTGGLRMNPVKQQQNNNRTKAQNLAKQRIGSGTAKNPDTTIAQVKQQNQDSMRANAAQRNQKFQQNRQQGGQQQAARKPGFLDRVKSRVGAIKQGVGNVVKSGVSGVKRVAGGVADAATGNLTDFDKRGGKPQGLSRVVAGGIDKLTGDRTDLDKRGPSKGAPQQAQGKPAQQQAKPAPQQAQQPVKKMGSIEQQNRQKFGNERIDALKAKNAEFQAAKKSGNLAQYRKDNPKLSGKERAQAMAKARIAAKNSAQGSQSF